jgi:hypothetical protein
MQNVLVILQLIPAIITVIKALEESIPGQGQGEAKLAAVRQILESIDAVSKAVWPSLQKVIEILVATFNATGVFKKTE